MAATVDLQAAGPADRRAVASGRGGRTHDKVGSYVGRASQPRGGRLARGRARRGRRRRRGLPGVVGVAAGAAPRRSCCKRGRPAAVARRGDRRDRHRGDRRRRSAGACSTSSSPRACCARRRAQAYGADRRGHPVRRARHARHGRAPARRRGRRHRAVERAGDPRRRARSRRRSRTATRSCSRPPSSARARTARSSRRSSTPGCPTGVVNLVTNAPGRRRGRRRRADRASGGRGAINFTGSTQVGRIIAEKAGAPPQARAARARRQGADGRARRRRPRRAPSAAANFGAFMHQGQICMSTERIVVDRDGRRRVRREARRAGRARCRSATRASPSTQIGPLINAGAPSSAWPSWSRTRVDKGAEVADRRRGRRPVLPADRALRRHAGDAHLRRGVVRPGGLDRPGRRRRRGGRGCANDTEYGLSAAVFGRDVPRRCDVARRIETGICHVNGTTVHDEAQMPFGGVKAQRLRAASAARAALEEFTELRWITVQARPRHYPI